LFCTVGDEQFLSFLYFFSLVITSNLLPSSWT
jgi:hypothetical protein